MYDKKQSKKNGRNARNSVSERLKLNARSECSQKRHNMAKQYSTPDRRGIKSGNCTSMHEMQEQVKLVMKHRQMLTEEKLSSCIRRNVNSTSNETCVMF